MFAGAPFRWWIAGGHALELHAVYSWRDHGDIDVGICRVDAARVSEWLDGWELAVASSGQLARWNGDPLTGSQNTVWCRRPDAAAWVLDISVGAGDASGWRYRRDESVVRAWDDAVLRTVFGVPYLAPELQLLFKSKDARPKDDLDAGTVTPRLDAPRRAALRSLLPAEHPWHSLVGARGRGA